MKTLISIILLTFCMNLLAKDIGIEKRASLVSDYFEEIPKAAYNSRNVAIWLSSHKVQKKSLDEIDSIFTSPAMQEKLQKLARITNGEQIILDAKIVDNSLGKVEIYYTVEIKNSYLCGDYYPSAVKGIEVGLYKGTFNYDYTKTGYVEVNSSPELETLVELVDLKIKNTQELIQDCSLLKTTTESSASVNVQ